MSEEMRSHYTVWNLMIKVLYKTDQSEKESTNQKYAFQELKALLRGIDVFISFQPVDAPG